LSKTNFFKSLQFSTTYILLDLNQLTQVFFQKNITLKKTDGIRY